MGLSVGRIVGVSRGIVESRGFGVDVGGNGLEVGLNVCLGSTVGLGLEVGLGPVGGVGLTSGVE